MGFCPHYLADKRPSSHTNSICKSESKIVRYNMDPSDADLRFIADHSIHQTVESLKEFLENALTRYCAYFTAVVSTYPVRKDTIMKQFKPRPPMIEGIQFLGDYFNAVQVIDELREKDIVALYSPEIQELEMQDYLLVFGRGNRRESMRAGDWIIWDPTPKMLDMKYMDYENGWTILSNDEVYRRYMDRTDADG